VSKIGSTLSAVLLNDDIRVRQVYEAWRQQLALIKSPPVSIKALARDVVKQRGRENDCRDAVQKGIQRAKTLINAINAPLPASI
jgi:hypothetical protein